MPGDRVPIQCQAGHFLSPKQSPIIACQSDGTWMSDAGIIPTCTVSSCLPPLTIRDGGYDVIPADGVGHDGLVRSQAVVVYYCLEGFKMSPEDSSMISCQDGSWVGQLPRCRPKSAADLCGPVPEVARSKPYLNGFPLSTANKNFGNGVVIVYVCHPGYRQHGSATITCVTGEWRGQGPDCVRAENDCVAPPPIVDGDYTLVPSGNRVVVGGGERIPEKSHAYYYCRNGYKMAEMNASSLVCSGGEWQGQLPNCVKRTHCDVPMDIPNGNWIITSTFADYRISSRVKYECESQFRAIGSTEIECMPSGYWTDYPPKCLIKDAFCDEPVSPSDGFFMCNPTKCDDFKVGTEVHYMCSKSYEPRSGDDLVQTCLPGGQWSGERPVCLPTFAMSPATASSSSYLSASTVTVVISTSCGVLGLLVLVLVVVAVKRRIKPNGMICPPVTGGPPPPMPYPTPHHGAAQEHDRLALIAFADDNRGVMQVSLPTYEEATRSHFSGISHLTGGGDGSRTSSIRSSHSRGDYRPLPSIPPSLRAPRETVTAATEGGHRGDHHRNSIVTTASIATRDNLSVAFGSMDTVNASDGTSTSVTVDTYDSMASNPSIATSQRAAAGSLESSSTHGSLSNEAVPLLLPRETHRGDRDVSPGNGVVVVASNSATDTLRSQTSRTHSESSPIIEVPEESKDD